MLDAPEFERWHDTARDAASNAAAQAEQGAHHWACFLAEQAAQFALKGLLHGFGRGGWGHDLTDLGGRLATTLEEDLPEPVADALARLSRHYIAARYPDAHPAGTPSGHYRRADAAQAIADAETVLTHVESVWTAAQADDGGGDGAG